MRKSLTSLNEEGSDILSIGMESSSDTSFRNNKTLWMTENGKHYMRSMRLISSADNRSVFTTFSALSSKLSRLFFCFIESVFFIKLFNDPNSFIKAAAIFGPIPGAPGMLSDESPASARTSPKLSDETPLKRNQC